LIATIRPRGRPVDEWAWVELTQEQVQKLGTFLAEEGPA